MPCQTNPDLKSLIWLSGVTEWHLVSSTWVCPHRSGSESQQCPTRESPPLAEHTDFYLSKQGIFCIAHTFTYWGQSVPLWTPISQSETFGAKNQPTEDFFFLTLSKKSEKRVKECKPNKELKAVNIQFRGWILENHMRLPAVTATGSSCRCHFLSGDFSLFPGGNAQVSRKPHWKASRGRRPDAKESRLESEGPAEEKIDTKLISWWN